MTDSMFMDGLNPWADQTLVVVLHLRLHTTAMTGIGAPLRTAKGREMILAPETDRVALCKTAQVCLKCDNSDLSRDKHVEQLSEHERHDCEAAKGGGSFVILPYKGTLCSAY